MASNLNIVKDGTGPVFIVEPPSKVDFSLTTPSLIVNCLIHGDPEPTVTWHKQDGTEILDRSRISGGLLSRILRNNSLELSTSGSNEEMDKFDASQASIYNCKASNKYGAIISRPVHINKGTFIIMFLVKYRLIWPVQIEDLKLYKIIKCTPSLE